MRGEPSAGLGDTLHNFFSWDACSGSTIAGMEAAAAHLYDDAPRVIIWEMTRACALACRHCRAEAIPHRNPEELSTTEAFALVDSIARCGNPIVVFTGGDPLMRDDIYKIIEHATERGLRIAVSPSATGRLRDSSLLELARAGCERISLSLDAADAEIHDNFRGVKGSFERTLAGYRSAREHGISVQINTTIARFNHLDVDRIAEMLAELDIALWSVFFLVPTGRAELSEVLDAAETEEVFRNLDRLESRLPFGIKTTEAPHYRRYRSQRIASMPPRERPATIEPPWQRVPAVGDGKGFVFISHIGEISPSGFLPYVCGNVRDADLLDVYRNNPVMQRLRRPETFGGKCGVCEFRELCGGSRSRAYTMTGDAFAAEPSCVHKPIAIAEAV